MRSSRSELASVLDLSLLILAFSRASSRVMPLERETAAKSAIGGQPIRAQSIHPDHTRQTAPFTE
jgi:hypothetical protein